MRLLCGKTVVQIQMEWMDENEMWKSITRFKWFTIPSLVAIFYCQKKNVFPKSWHKTFAHMILIKNECDKQINSKLGWSECDVNFF